MTTTAHSAADQEQTGGTKFYGKYRGTVASNADPLALGRLQVDAPAVLGSGRLVWAMPCAPYFGAGVGLLALPPVGARVWVEFEAGDPDFPIWTGGFWDNGEMPLAQPREGVHVLKTANTTLTLDDSPSAGGVTIEVRPPAVPQAVTLTLDVHGITLQSGSSVLRVGASGCELSSGTSVVSVDARGAQIHDGPTGLKISPDGGELRNGANVLRVSPAAAEVDAQTSSVKASVTGLQLQSVPASVTLDASNIELKIGAADVKLTPASVNVNNGALEVL